MPPGPLGVPCSTRVRQRPHRPALRRWHTPLRASTVSTTRCLRADKRYMHDDMLPHAQVPSGQVRRAHLDALVVREQAQRPHRPGRQRVRADVPVPPSASAPQCAHLSMPKGHLSTGDPQHPLCVNREERGKKGGGGVHQKCQTLGSNPRLNFSGHVCQLTGMMSLSASTGGPTASPTDKLCLTVRCARGPTAPPSAWGTTSRRRRPATGGAGGRHTQSARRTVRLASGCAVARGLGKHAAARVTMGRCTGARPSHYLPLWRVRSGERRVRARRRCGDITLSPSPSPSLSPALALGRQTAGDCLPWCSCLYGQQGTCINVDTHYCEGTPTLSGYSSLPLRVVRCCAMGTC